MNKLFGVILMTSCLALKADDKAINSWNVPSQNDLVDFIPSDPAVPVLDKTVIQAYYQRAVDVYNFLTDDSTFNIGSEYRIGQGELGRMPIDDDDKIIQGFAYNMQTRMGIGTTHINTDAQIAFNYTDATEDKKQVIIFIAAGIVQWKQQRIKNVGDWPKYLMLYIIKALSMSDPASEAVPLPVTPVVAPIQDITSAASPITAPEVIAPITEAPITPSASAPAPARNLTVGEKIANAFEPVKQFFTVSVPNFFRTGK